MWDNTVLPATPLVTYSGKGVRITSVGSPILTPLPLYVTCTHLSTPEGRKAELICVAVYTKMVRWFTQRRSPIQVLTGPDVE